MTDSRETTEATTELSVAVEALCGHVVRLGGEIGERNVDRPRSLAAARGYIEDVWRRQGYQVTTQEYPVDDVVCANLEVTRPGAHSDEIFLIGAHYDSVRGSPGANDNGSGVAAMLELSRLFAGLVPALTLRFVAFVNEEPPFFATSEQGSLVYARAARARGDKVRLMIALETIGYYSHQPGSQHYPPLFRYFYPDRGNFLGFVADFGSRHAMHDMARRFRKASDFPLEHAATFRFVPGATWSDHRSFWKMGYRAFMVTDTAPFRYPYYHTPADTPDKVSYEDLARVTDGLYHAFASYALEHDA